MTESRSQTKNPVFLYRSGDSGSCDIGSTRSDPDTRRCADPTNVRGLGRRPSKGGPPPRNGRTCAWARGRSREVVHRPVRRRVEDVAGASRERRTRLRPSFRHPRNLSRRRKGSLLVAYGDDGTRPLPRPKNDPNDSGPVGQVIIRQRTTSSQVLCRTTLGRESLSGGLPLEGHTCRPRRRVLDGETGRVGRKEEGQGTSAPPSTTTERLGRGNRS